MIESKEFIVMIGGVDILNWFKITIKERDPIQCKHSYIGIVIV
jgi:hypothetical protein